MARADRRAADCRALTGVPTVPMVGLLAVADARRRAGRALRVAGHRARRPDVDGRDSSTAGTSLPPERPATAARHASDRFGIAHAVLALGDGADAAALPRVLRGLSRSTGSLGTAGRGRRPGRGIGGCASALVRIAFARSAIRRRPAWPSSCLTDDTVIAVMAAAVDVVEAAGCAVGPRRRPQPRTCAGPCTGGATAADRSTRCTAAAAPTSPGLAAAAAAREADDRRRRCDRSARRTHWWPASIPG